MNHQPDKCAHTWAKNGRYNSKRRGQVQRWRCNACDANRKDYERAVEARLLRPFALIAVGLSFDQAEYLTKIKAETIRGRLISCHRDPECWASVTEGLVQLQVEAKKIERLEDQIHDLSTEHHSVRLRAFQYGPASDLGDRIEAIIGKPVLITESRQGYRLCTRADFDKLIQILRRMPLERIISLSQFSDDEMRVLRELRTHLRVGRLMATIFSSECEYDPVTRKVIQPPLTLQTLACALSMEYERLLSITIKLALKVRKVRL